jgi:trehalose synthase
VLQPLVAGLFGGYQPIAVPYAAHLTSVVISAGVSTSEVATKRTPTTASKLFFCAHSARPSRAEPGFGWSRLVNMHDRFIARPWYWASSRFSVVDMGITGSGIAPVSQTGPRCAASSRGGPLRNLIQSPVGDPRVGCGREGMPAEGKKGIRGNANHRGPMVSLAEAVKVERRPVAQLRPVIGGERERCLLRAADAFRDRLNGRSIWNVSSTAVGGGVAEMLHTLIGYAEDLDIPVRWSVITGDAEFFVITKRLHNQIHGEAAGGPLSPDDAEHYDRMLAANAAELLEQVQPGDLVLLHDPQTAGLASVLARAGARVAWRCHIGVDWANDATRAAWEFLRPRLADADGFVFTRREYVPPWVPTEKIAIIPPSIDPLSPKNQDLDPGAVQGILARIGVLDDVVPDGGGCFSRAEGGLGSVTRAAEVTGDGRPGPDDPVVVQVSRWDGLKDMPGVMSGFAEYVAPGGLGYLMLVGPAVAGVTDDPEGAAVFGDCLLQWRDLPASARDRVLLVTLPLDDPDENAAMVNALQRHATVIVQKSLAEGFGLTVAEGMWKGRPVVGSAVGGIIDQIADGTGILLPDPRDLRAFGSAVRGLLDDPAEASRMGRAARAYIREHYVGDLHLLRYAELFSTLLAGAETK